MKLSGLLALAVLSLPGAVGAQSLPVNRDKVWFKPSLTVDSAPVCADILRVEQDAFFSENGQVSNTHVKYDQAGLRGPDLRTTADSSLKIVWDSPDRQWVLTRPDGRKLFVRITSDGCGRWCDDIETLLVAEQRFDPQVPDDVLFGAYPDAPQASQWGLYKPTDGDFHALGTMDDRLRVYRLADAASVQLECEVILKPDKLSEHEDPEVRRAAQEMERLLQAYASVSHRGGMCSRGYAQTPSIPVSGK